MAWGTPKTPKQGTARHRAAYKEGRRGLGAAPYDHVNHEDLPDVEDSGDESVGFDFTDPDEGSPWITPQRTDALCAQIRCGVPIPVAAIALGFSNEVWKSWMSTGREDKARGKKPGFGVNESPYVYFLHKLDQARAQCEASLLMAIHAAAAHDWKAAAWRAERLAPKRHHLASKLEIEASSGKDDDISRWTTARVLQAAKGQLEAEVIKALPADVVVDGELESE